MSDDEEKFKLVTSGRRGKRREGTKTKHSSNVYAPLSRTSPSLGSETLEAQNSHPTLARVAEITTLINHALTTVRLHGSFVVETMADSIRTFIGKTTETTGFSRNIKVVSLGIGSICGSSNARIQLAALLEVQLLMRDEVVLACEHFDPAFVPLDLAVLHSLGHTVADNSPSGAISLADARPAELNTDNVGGSQATERPRHRDLLAPQDKSPCIFYMVHCNAELYEDVLRSHWGPPLEQICIIGNSFSWVAGQRGPAVCESAIAGLLACLTTDVDGATPTTGSNTYHLDAACGSLLGTHEWRGATSSSSECVHTLCETGPSPWPLVVHERSLGVAARDRDREYQHIYMAFDATSVHTFNWRLIEGFSNVP